MGEQKLPLNYEQKRIQNNNNACQGVYTQREVSEKLIKMGYSSASLSTIEKLLAKLRKRYKVKTTIELFVLLTKKGLL